MTNTTLIFICLIAGTLLALNPTTIAIFSALLMGSLGKGHSKTQRHGVALAFLLIYFFSYAFLGSLIVIGLSNLTADALEIVAVIVSIFAIVWGLINIKDYYWYGSHRDISVRLAKILHTRTVKKNDPASAGILGLTAVYATIPSSGLAIASIATIISLTDPFNTRLMPLLALILALPLLLIFITSLRGTKLSSIVKWKEDSKGVFRLCIGLTSIFLGWIILLILNGTIGVAR